jgi:hypothetical protein
MVAGCDPEIVARAVNYLYTKETKSSFEIEHEVATGPLSGRPSRSSRLTRRALSLCKTSLSIRATLPTRSAISKTSSVKQWVAIVKSFTSFARGLRTLSR